MEKTQCPFPGNDKIYIALIITLLLLSLSFPLFALDGTTKNAVNIGLLFDGKDIQANSDIALLRSELKALLGSGYDINIKNEHIQFGQWTLSTIEKSYDQMVSDSQIHIIIGIGGITGAVIAQKKTYKKPVIVIGIVDPVVQGLSPVVDNTSGIHNLTYIMGNRSIISDLESFHKVYNYEKLGFVYFKELSKAMTDQGRQSIDHVMDKKRSNMIKIPVERSVEDVFKYLDQVDAVYISYLGKFEGKDKQYLIQELNKRKIPTFGSTLADIRSGILAAMAPEDIINKMIRRITLNIEAILEGRDPADLKVYTEFEKHLTINMKTAGEIGFSPKFTVLHQANLVNDDYVEAERTVNLIDVMKEVVKNNLDLGISQTYVENAGHDISEAKTDYYPDFTAGLNGVIIDEKRAQESYGSLAERTTTGTLEATQLIYSDQVIGNITSQKHLLKAAQYDYENTQLDVIFNAINAYFAILKAKTSRKILEDNVDLIKRNLKTAEQREVIGYSGRSDVLRWKSQLATTSTKLLAAKQDIIVAKNALNRILNRSQEELFQIEDASLDGNIFSAFRANTVEIYIDNQKSLDLFTRFYVDQCIKNSVEIKQLNEKKSALKRSVSSLKRKYYLPTVSFSITGDHVFSRNGEGSDVSGSNPIDNPWTAGIYLNLPFYEGGSVSVDIQKALVQISRIQKQKLLLAQEIEDNARSVLSKVMVTMVNLESSEQAALYAKQSLELVQDSYSKGTVSVVELADAQNNALNGELNATNSIHEYLLSLFELEKVYGTYSLLLPEDSQDRISKRFKEYHDKSTN